MTAETPKLTFERVFASPSLDGSSPRQAKLSPDGRWLTLLRNRETDRERYDLWGYDRESGAWTMLVDSEKLGSGRDLSEDEKMQRERARVRSEEHTSELQSLMRTSYAVICLKKKKTLTKDNTETDRTRSTSI